MYWMTIPLLAINIVLMCAVFALREKWAWSTFAIFVTFVVMWLVIVNCLMDDVANGRH